MSDNIHYLEERFKNAEKFLPHPDKHGGGGGGSGGGEQMEKRLEAIEKSLPEIKEKLAGISGKVESIDKHSATKADLATTELNLIKWYVATAFAMTGLASAITFGLTKLLAH